MSDALCMVTPVLILIKRTRLSAERASTNNVFAFSVNALKFLLGEERCYYPPISADSLAVG